MDNTAIIGAGVIGASWAALFLAAGKNVAVYDPSPTVEADVTKYVDTAWPVLTELGLTEPDRKGVLTFHATAAEAVENADFIQESVPERIEIKHATFAAMEPALQPHAIVSTSASGLTVTEMQEGWKDPSRFILGHPFNPPHLIPLVELLANDKTAGGVLEAAEDFYKSIGKVTIRVQKEVAGHVSNRLQAALWREAIHLVQSGAVSVEDVDKAVWAGPGLRWGAMGPNTIWNLAAGPGGLGEYIERYRDSFHRWWDDLGDPRLDAETTEKLVTGAIEAMGGKSMDEMNAQRDAMLVAMQAALAKHR
ncbi:MAG: 3-hydroxyacyl-CoA dehydrogenase NAD-binding domain-containing protein [Pseudomonadota bacterium]